jgi:hypothetical protein
MKKASTDKKLEDIEEALRILEAKGQIVRTGEQRPDKYGKMQDVWALNTKKPH